MGKTCNKEKKTDYEVRELSPNDSATTWPSTSSAILDSVVHNYNYSFEILIVISLSPLLLSTCLASCSPVRHSAQYTWSKVLWRKMSQDLQSQEHCPALHEFLPWAQYLPYHSTVFSLWNGPTSFFTIEATRRDIGHHHL